MGESALPADDQCDLLCLDLPHAEDIRTSLPALDALTSAATLGKALADPTRLAVGAALLTGDELCVCDMAWVVGQAQNLASHHLRVLRAAGLVTSRRDGKLVMYRLTPVGRALMGAVLDGTSAPDRATLSNGQRPSRAANHAGNEATTTESTAR